MTAAERIEDRSKRTTPWYDLVGEDPHHQLADLLGDG